MSSQSWYCCTKCQADRQEVILNLVTGQLECASCGAPVEIRLAADLSDSDVYHGVFYSIFNNSVALVLDQVNIVGKMEQTISALSELTNLSYPTTDRAVSTLTKAGLMEKTRMVGNAQVYAFNTRIISLLSLLLTGWGGLHVP